MYKIILGLLAMSFLGLSHAENIDSLRYGKIQIKANPKNAVDTLYFNHNMIKPKIEGNNSLSLVGTYRLGAADVVLVQDNGGNGCPAQLKFVKITADKKVSISPTFGSCSDLIKVQAKVDKITVTMPDFIGSPESEAEARAVAQHKMTYIYNGKNITENGEILKDER